MISVELVPDATTDAAVRRDWQALVDAGLPSAGRHTGESNAPHVTLLAVDAPRWLDPTASAAALAEQSAALPLSLTLGALLLFPSREGTVVLARAVVMTEPLMALQGAVSAAVGPGVANTEPGRWTPHVTLATRMPVGDLPRALDVVSREPIAGEAVAMRVWDSVAKMLTPVGQIFDR